MERNNNEAAVCADPIGARAGSTDEIDLYDELTAFAELTPEEQQRLVDRPETRPTETEEAPADEAAEPVSPDRVLANTPIEPVVSDTTPEETKQTLAEEAEDQASHEPVLVHAPIESVEGEATEPAAESASGAEDSSVYVERTEVRPEVFVRPSGPLGSLTVGFVFTGALSRGVCLACGAESGADDLFCITCGVFIDEISSTLPVKPACSECKQGISVDEIFCPWCGSAQPAGEPAKRSL